MKYRKQANYIYSINDASGQRTDGFLEVGKVVTEFYQKLLGSTKDRQSPHLTDNNRPGPVLTMDQQMLLGKVITDKEIQEVIFSIPNDKSPRADGYSNRFFKAC